MNILGLHIGKAENRQATDYAAAVTQALQDAATNSTAKADALAVVETCATLIADSFLVAETTGPMASRRTLYTAARDVLRTGNSVWAIDTSNGNLELQRAYKWDVSGPSLSPSAWTYELELRVPDGVLKKRLPSAGVVHLRLVGPADCDWQGSAPWQHAELSADTIAELER